MGKETRILSFDEWKGNGKGQFVKVAQAEIPFILSSCMYSLEVLSCSILFSFSISFFVFSSIRRANTDGATVRKIHLSKSNAGGKLNTIERNDDKLEIGRKKIFIIN